MNCILVKSDYTKRRCVISSDVSDDVSDRPPRNVWDKINKMGFVKIAVKNNNKQ